MNVLTDAAQLRRALTDVLALDALPADDVYTLKADDLRAVRALDEFAVGDDPPIRLAGLVLFEADAPMLHRLRRALRREPERARRLVGLTYANWLAHFETPADRRPRRGR